MKTTIVITGLTVLLTAATGVLADDKADLIARDKAWGEARDAGFLESLLADDLLALSPAGNETKGELIAQETADDAPTGPYMAGDYKVQFVGDDVAVMSHSVTGDDAHWSMHVWHKQGGNWKVVATASIPAANE